MPEDLPQPQTINSPNNPPVKGSKKFNSGKVVVTSSVIVLVIALIALGLWYFVQNSKNNAPADGGVKVTKVATSSTQPKVATPAAKDETSDWKTYSNSEVKFSIKYPPSWKINDSAINKLCTSDQTFFAPSEDLLGKCASGFGGLIGITRSTDSPNLAGRTDSYSSTDYKDLKKENLILSGKSASRISGISQIKNGIADLRGTNVIVYLIDSSTGIIMISYNQSPSSQDNSLTFEKMVSTLKLL